MLLLSTHTGWNPIPTSTGSSTIRITGNDGIAHHARIVFVLLLLFGGDSTGEGFEGIFHALLLGAGGGGDGAVSHGGYGVELCIAKDPLVS